MDRPFRLLLVDDEPLALRRLRGFPLADRGFEIVGEAENGLQALQAAERLQPDIVVTDIGMPVMDGLELLKRLRERPASPKVVLLTCYEDFDKAQAALRYGAEDYVTKVLLSEEEFMKTLEKAAAALRKEIGDSERLLRLQLQDLLLYPGPESAAALKEAGFVHDAMAVAVIRTERTLPDGWAEGPLSADAGETGAARESVRCLPVRISPRVWCLVYRSDPRESDCSFFGRYSRHYARVAQGLRDLPEAGDFIVSAGTVCHRPEDLPAAFRRALERCDAGYYGERGEPVGEGGGVRFAPYPAELFRRLLADIAGAAQAADGAEACRLLREWASGIGMAYRPAPEQVRQMAAELADRLEGFAPERDDSGASEGPAGRSGADGERPPAAAAPPDDSAARAGSALTARFRQCAERALHAAALRGEAAALADLLARRYPAGGGMRTEIREALRLISRDYASIELGEAARQVNLSPSWFAALFRSETGRSFHDYVQQCRLDRAKGLLRTTDMKVYEIAQRVGIPNSRYFSRLFSEHAGVTPLDYRKRAETAT